jgi:HPt (histidine-containing phosphotransfer) domain-containing protein
LNITDQEGTTKLEVLQKAKVAKTAHTLEQLAEQDTHENDDDNDDDDAVDRELERVQQKIQQLQKEIREPAASKKKGLRKARKT